MSQCLGKQSSPISQCLGKQFHVPGSHVHHSVPSAWYSQCGRYVTQQQRSKLTSLLLTEKLRFIACDLKPTSIKHELTLPDVSTVFMLRSSSAAVVDMKIEKGERERPRRGERVREGEKRRPPDFKKNPK